MKTETNEFSTATENALVSIESGKMHADVYFQYERPVAIVLWKGAGSQPYAAFKDSDDGRLQRFALTSNDDVPRHDRHYSRLNMQVEMFAKDGVVRALTLYEQAGARPFLTVVGGAGPLPLQPFNVRRNGIFCHDFRDRDGLPVGDTFVSTFRAALYGREGRDWTNERLAALVAEYSSDQMASIMQTVSIKSGDDEWRMAHQDRGIAASGELNRLLSEYTAQQSKAQKPKVKSPGIGF